MGLDAVAIETGEDEVRGINSQAQLAEAEAALQKRLRASALDAGGSARLNARTSRALRRFGFDAAIEVIFSLSSVDSERVGRFRKAVIKRVSSAARATLAGDVVRPSNIANNETPLDFIIPHLSESAGRFFERALKP
jgi:bifunctional N-acetylglucosamine-1-phosphate-uridyltransferase/glucosamine-1-phosphate-acetyltransferase GlmU-like protein